MAAARAIRALRARRSGKFCCYIEERHGGIVPPALVPEASRVQAGYGCARRYTESSSRVSIRAPSRSFPTTWRYLIHAAGNPHAIAELDVDCLQPIPLLEDRELLVWSKGRSGRLQRRAFRTTDPFEPPALVREIDRVDAALAARMLPQLTATDSFSARVTIGVASFSPSWLVQEAP